MFTNNNDKDSENRNKPKHIKRKVLDILLFIAIAACFWFIIVDFGTILPPVVCKIGASLSFIYMLYDLSFDVFGHWEDWWS